MSLLHPVQIGPVRLRNGIVKAATYEGMTPGGRAADALVLFHRRLAQGGLGMTTVAYGAVAPEGRTFGDQLLVDDDAAPALRALADAVHEEGACIALQLADAGGFRKLPGTPRGPSARWNLYGLLSGAPRVRAMTDADLDACEADFVSAALQARSAGFDAVEVHAGHGYLLHQFLSPATNHRTDAWGGDAARRMAFPVRVVRAVVEAVGATMAVLVKMNLEDGHAGGLEVRDAVQHAQAFANAGAHALVLSCGVVDRTPFHLLRGEAPLAQMAAVEKNPWQRLAMRVFGPSRVRPVPYEPLFLLPLARTVRSVVDIPLLLLGGVTTAAHLVQAADHGFQGVQVGRALLHDPDWPHRVQAQGAWASGCTHCNLCVVEMDRGGVRCVLNDASPADPGAGATPS